jgi:hypothetical protein
MTATAFLRNFGKTDAGIVPEKTIFMLEKLTQSFSTNIERKRSDKFWDFPGLKFPWLTR